MNPTRSVCFQDAIQGSPLHPRAGGVVSPHSFPELVWAGAVSVLGLRGHCFLKSKRATACWRVGATSTPDSRMAGQAVRVPKLPERLRPHTARVAMCAGPDPAWPLPEGRAASGKWLPYLGPWFFHLRMEGLSSAGGWAGLP